MRTRVGVVVIGLAGLVWQCGDGAAAAGEVAGEVLVMLHRHAPSLAHAAGSELAHGRVGVQGLDETLGRVGAYRIHPSSLRLESERAARRFVVCVLPGTERAAAGALMANPLVRWAAPSFTWPTASVPSDTGWTSQWNYSLAHLQAAWAWNRGTGSPEILVGVIDTGLDYAHPELSANMWSGGNGRDFCGGTSWWCTGVPDDDPQHVYGGTHSHGTKVAGVISARANNGYYYAGLAGGWGMSPGASLVGLRAGPDISDTTGAVWPLPAADAVEWAMANTDDPIVFNMSFAGPGTLPALEAEIDSAWATGRALFVGCSLGSNGAATAIPELTSMSSRSPASRPTASRASRAATARMWTSLLLWATSRPWRTTWIPEPTSRG